MNRTVKLLLVFFSLTFSFTSSCFASWSDDDDDYYDYYAFDTDGDGEDDLWVATDEDGHGIGIGYINDEGVFEYEVIGHNSKESGEDEDRNEGDETKKEEETQYEEEGLPEVIIYGHNRTDSSGDWRNKAISWLNAHAYSYSSYCNIKEKKCAKNVRLALEAAGFNTTGHPEYAKDYGDFLKKLGFKEVSRIGYSPRVGDIRVWQNYPGGNIAGHIHMYNGTKWVSDFVEPNVNGPGRDYRRYNNYKIYRK